MDYQNSTNLLPKELIEQIQKYVDPESVKLVVKSHAHFALFCSELSLTTAR